VDGLDPQGVKDWGAALAVTAVGLVWAVFSLLKKMGVVPDKKQVTVTEIQPCDDSDCLARLATMETRIDNLEKSVSKLDHDTWDAFGKVNDGLKTVAGDIRYFQGRIEGK
jgi:hypothetical protein